MSMVHSAQERSIPAAAEINTSRYWLKMGTIYLTPPIGWGIYLLVKAE